MSLSVPTTTLEFYTRDDCPPCAAARESLQAVLEERARRGDPVPRISIIDLAHRPEFEASHGARVPVIAVAGQELALSPSYRQIEIFLDRVLGRLA
jgi:peroxiredoxin